MSGSIPDRAKARLPIGLFGMLALILIVESAISARRADLVTPWADDWRLSALAAESKAKDADILCFGDSLIKYGVMPKVIEARSGLKAYNLAISGGTMASSYFLFRRAIDQGARPKAVVLDIAALMLLEEKPPNPLNYAELGTWSDCLDLASTSRDGDLLGALVAGKLLPTYRWRFEIRQDVLAAIEGRSTSKRADLASFRILWNRELGAQPTPKARIYHPQEEFLVDGVSPRKWACDPKERDYAERFLALAESRKIAVYWLIPPMSPIVQARRLERGTDARYDRFVRSIASKFPSVTILDARASGYDDSVHLDHIHLNRQGGTILSGDLAEVVLGDLKSGLARESSRRTLPPLAGRTGSEPSPGVARNRNSPPAHGDLR